MSYRPATTFVGHTLTPEQRGEVARLNDRMDAFGAHVVIHEQAVPTWFSIASIAYGETLSRHGSLSDLRDRVDQWYQENRGYVAQIQRTN